MQEEEENMNKNTSAVRPVRYSWFRPILFGSAFVLLALVVACSRTGENQANTIAGNDPDKLLRQMSEKLSKAQNLSFKVLRKLDAALVEGRNVAESAVID